MVYYASADQVARAIIAAARLTGADPLAIFEQTKAHVSGDPKVRARYLALAGLLAAFPELPRAAAARCVGCGPTGEKNAWKILQASWLRDDWVDEVVGAILAPEAEEAPRAAMPARSREERLRRYYRPSPAVKRSAGAALDMGEPAPGRSALDERRGARIERGEDDEGGRRRGKISLPRLKFMEREFEMNLCSHQVAQE